ncbi:hypothetical protein Tco_1305543 [Tanacetum coccineum]
MKSTISFEARTVKRVDESRSISPPFKKKKKTQQPVHDGGARSTPNYMKSTISFEARTVKRVDESRSLSPPFKKKKKTQQPVHDDGARSTPNYVKSTISFEARTVKRVDESRSVSPPFKKKKKTQQPVHDDGARSTPNYMKSTISFEARTVKRVDESRSLSPPLEARKEQSPKSTTPKVARKLNTGDLASGKSSLTKTTNFKPSRPSSAKRHALKTQKSFKVGCLSRRPRTPIFKKDDVKEPVIVATKAPQKVDMEEENRDFFLEIYSKDRQEKGNQDLECLDIDWEEGYCSALFSDNANDFCKQLYHGETVTSGAWSEEEDGDSELDGSY